MSNLCIFKLGDLIAFQRGFDITKKEQVLGVIPVISSSGVTSCHNVYKIEGPGVIIGRKGTLGTVHYMASNFWPHDTTLWIKDFKGNNPKFIYYLLKTLHLENFDTGASNPTLNRNHLHKIKILAPDKKEQKKIAAILSAYDDLLEVNKRKIKVLETLAEEIYKEWFVRLRFPGHEQATFEKGIPEGWRQVSMSIFASCKYGYTESAIEDDSLPKFLRVTDINKKSYIYWKDVPNCSIDDLDFEKYRLRYLDIVIARMADPGKVAIVEEDIKAVIASYLIKIDYNREFVTPYYFFYTLRSDYYAGIFSGANSGATRGSINAKAILATKVILPSLDILEEFELAIKRFREQITQLVKANETLIQTRDLLLSRLISGKLSVADLDIAFPPSMEEVEDLGGQDG